MKHTSRLLLFALALTVALVAWAQGPLAAIVATAIGSAAITMHPLPGHCYATTLVSREILADIIGAFRLQLPMINRMGIEFRPSSLKLGKQYTAHIPSVPTVDDVSTTYNTTGNDARGLLTDVDLTVDKHKGSHLFWDHFQMIRDDKATYQEVIQLAGYALAKDFIDNLLSGVTTQNFTSQKTYAAADFDLDALIDLAGTGNTQKMNPIGRGLFISTEYANYLSLDGRITNRNDGNGAAREVQGNSLRRWTNVGGFAEIIEYPDMPTNNGTALTGVTGTAATDLLGKTGHGLLTGDPATISFASGFTGLTSGTKYYVIKASADTFKLATTRANAEAGTAIDIGADGTGATVTKTENLGAFAFDRRAFAALAGPPESSDPALAAQLGVPISMAVESVTYEGITMGVAKWQDTGTGRLHWVPTLLWGKALGRQGSANAALSLTDRAGIRVITA